MTNIQSELLKFKKALEIIGNVDRGCTWDQVEPQVLEAIQYDEVEAFKSEILETLREWIPSELECVPYDQTTFARVLEVFSINN